MKVVAKAPANIAFIKYWGKKNEKLRLPANSSISMNLSETFTTTSIEVDKNLKDDFVKINGKVADAKELERVLLHLERIRKLAKIKFKAKVESVNNFPKGTGIASSASGFAALTLAAVSAYGLTLSERKLSTLARLGSGSACRSIPDGFVEWKEGKTSDSSFAYSLYPPNYWDIRDLIVVVEEESKKVSSTKGHDLAESSPFFKIRIRGMNNKIRELKDALSQRDSTKFGEIIEAEALNMHAVMMTSRPSLLYWLPETLKIMLAIVNWRNMGLEAYFTLDAGPTVHVICEGKNVAKLVKQLKKLEGIKDIIVNTPSIGARVID